MPLDPTPNLGLNRFLPGEGGVAGLLNENSDTLDEVIGENIDYAARQIVSPESQGAIGDGVADDTSAMTDAIAAAGPKGTVQLSRNKTYRVLSTLAVADSSVSIIGHGWGSQILWDGNNSTPVLKLSGWSGGRIANLRIAGAPGVSGKKATAAIELNSTSGHVNYSNSFQNVLIGPLPSETQSITFGTGILFSGTVNNDNMRFADMRIAYCDTGVNVNSGQAVDNIFDNVRVISCGTGTTLKAQTTLRAVLFSACTTVDMDVSNAAMVTANLVNSEGAVRFLTIAGQSHYTQRGGYFLAGANITAGGDFILGNDNANDQVVTLEDWHLTQVGGYAGPTPIISLKSAAAGSGAKVLNLIRVRGIVSTFTEANLDIVPVVSSSYRMVAQGQVYDSTAGTYRIFQNVLTKTTDTVSFQRFDEPAAHIVRIGAVQIQQGSGSPASVVTAPVGSLYLRNDGGANTTLYVKESGTGNTGWVAK